MSASTIQHFTETIPPAFVHFFRMRKAVSDPYSGFVYMNVTKAGDKYTLSCPKKGPLLKLYSDPFRKHVPFHYMATYKFQPENPASAVSALNSYTWDIDIRDASGVRVPVIEIDSVSTLFLRVVKRNILISVEPGVTVTDRFAMAKPVAAPATASSTVTDAINTIIALPAHAPDTSYLSEVITQAESALAAYTPPAPLLKKKKLGTPKLKPVAAAPAVAPAVPRGDLRLFVAKQLLELAQIKKEMCPITAEEYSNGNTAAMPCGHLFMQIAIEESFKKEPGKCPACRQPGRPTYV
jgi:hypothetical protein